MGNKFIDSLADSFNLSKKYPDVITNSFSWAIRIILLVWLFCWFVVLEKFGVVAKYFVCYYEKCVNPFNPNGTILNYGEVVGIVPNFVEQNLTTIFMIILILLIFVQIKWKVFK